MPSGGDDLMIIGRNFDSSTTLLFREYREDGTLVWSAEAPLDRKLLHQVVISSKHSIGTGRF